ncbi:unnamed protein product, partial [Symbiodinium sp. CCMP2456]
MALSEDAVREQLKNVIDPELFVNIVDLGLIYNVNFEDIEESEDKKVLIDMTMTSPACPAGPQLIGGAKQFVSQMEGVGDVDVKIVMDPPWGDGLLGISLPNSYPRSVFIYELITGGGLYAVDGSPSPSGSLLKEGTAMLAALASDFAAIDGVSVTVLKDSRLDVLEVEAAQQITVRSADEEREAFRQAVRSTDATLIIAPEFDGLHLRRTLWAEEDGAFLLSPGSDFVGIAGCKWECFHRWRLGN